MRRGRLLEALMIVVIACSFARAAEPGNGSLSRRKVARLARTAHTAEQYRTLADYYQTQRLQFAERARAEMHEWIRRTFDATGLDKYPRATDSSRYRYEYFKYEESRMRREEARYEDLAAADRASPAE
jgi:hypothetical protein